MARSVSVYICQSCGAQSRQFFGRCAACGSWNSLVEQALPAGRDGRPDRFRQSTDSGTDPPRPKRSTPIQDQSTPPLARLDTGFSELDRVLGGGLVPGALVLLGGDPGIGKSTLLLQVAQAMAGHCSVLSVSAEESAQQVRLRWRRLVPQPPRQDSPGGEGLQLLAETDLDRVLEELEALRPAVAVVDSIQALHDPNLSSAPGTVAQVRECAAALQRLAKHHGVALVLVGHVTKEGVLAGPKVLEHLVDAVLTFEGD
ncbi:MAG: AAA family ATPase, partial [Cyanobium sp.]